MEFNKLKLKFNNKELSEWLGSGLVVLGTDMLNDEEKYTRNELILLYLVSQRNNALSIQKAIEDKQKHGIKLSKETLQKLQKFMNQNRFSPLIGYGWKSEERAIEFLVDMGLKTGKPFLDKLLDSEYFQSMTSTMKEETFADEKNKRKAVAETLEKGDNENDC
jgi:hypothetical protein